MGFLWKSDETRSAIISLPAMSRSRWAIELADSSSSDVSASAAWERCIARAIRSCSGTSRSSSCPRHSRAIPIASADSNRKPAPTGSLNHPNILAVHDIGVHDGATWIVAELLEGETLRQRMDARPLPPRTVIDYAIQIANGLAAAHEHDIVHRDIKPANLFVTRDGRIKILDFGLAKLLGPEASGDATETVTTWRCSDRAGHGHCRRTCPRNRCAACAPIIARTSSVSARSCSRCWPGSHLSGAARLPTLSARS